MKTFILSLLLAVSFATNSQTQFVLSPDSVRIAYEVHSESRKEGMQAIVFVHGWACDRSYWKDQVKYFSKKLKVVSIDLAGHGESGLNRKAWTMEAFGEDVAAVVRELDLHNIIFVGHSMGSHVIAEAALRVRDRTFGLIMLDTYRNLGPGRSPESVEAFVAPFRSEFSSKTDKFVRSRFVADSDKELVSRVATDMASAPPNIALPTMEFALKYSRVMPATLKKLNLPVIAINTDVEPTDEASMQQYGVQVMIMPGVGHFLMMEDPNHFNHMLMEAIQTLNH